MKIPILNGVYTDNEPTVRVAYPKNYIPVVENSGVNTGYLKPADGIVKDGEGPGKTRGGINWNDVCYRVMGSELVSVADSGTVTILGDVGGIDQNVTMDYSFDRLAIASNEKLFYWDGSTLTEVVDPDLGVVLDVQWIDGYFMTTDGANLVVTELADPTQVSPLKYGASEIDPDPVVALLKLRNEIYALNRYTIELFNNIGGDAFPFGRREGAQIQKGCVGTHACCVFLETIAFIGSGRNEQVSIYLGVNGVANKIGTREIDEILEEYKESILSEAKLEARNDRNTQLLYVHLPDKTLVYNSTASQAFNESVWSVLSTSITGFEQYRARDFVFAYDKWLVGDSLGNNVGHFTNDVGSHWGETITWEFSTKMIYNEGNGAIINELELVSLPGRIELGLDPRMSTSYSKDGISFSDEKYIKVGKIGETNKRLAWFRNGLMRLFRIQRFRGDSTAHVTFLRLEAQIEPLTE